MMILGLTGSIAMGKSTVAALFCRLHVPVFDADQAVHRLLAKNGAGVAKVACQFPEAYEEGAINRKRLGQVVFSNEKALRALEQLLHPLVREMHGQFLKQARRQRRKLVVLEIPLLFEVGAEKRCDKVVTVSAPAFLQQRRALARQGMTKAKLSSILKRQVSDRRKRFLTDYLVYSGLGRPVMARQIHTILKNLSFG